VNGSTFKDLEYRTEIIGRIADLDRAQWAELIQADAADRGSICPLGHPFVRHEWLTALESSGSASPETGWTPLHLLLRSEEGPLMGAAILYAKDHSWGEFVFDHAWANAHQRNGIPYYPKLVAAIPFTPVAGPRLIARNAEVRAALAKALPILTRSGQLSSVHLLFPQAADEVALVIAPEPDQPGQDEHPEGADHETHSADEAPDENADHWLRRTGVQFHWQADGWTDFEDFLNSMAQPKRKKIRAERRKVAEAGVTVRVVDVAQSSVEEREFFIACYERTYYEHGGPPYLNHEFWNQVFNTMPEHFALVLAHAGDRPIASSLIAHDGANAWGRYWGAMERVPCLHFECCYYAPIEWAIQRKIQRFEGGAQGEHKLARGLLPVATSSYHWLSHPAFETAIERWLNRERSGVAHYLDELDERSPLRDPRGETA